MSGLSYAEERDMDVRFEAHQDRLADEAEQRARLGFDVGDHVTVGTGRVVFVIDGFGTRTNGQEYAELERADGTSRFHELANVDRLHRVCAAPSIDTAGFTVGQEVTVGKGRTRWVIESFSVAAATGETLAHLRPVDGYSGTTVEVDRLVAVQ